MKLNYIYLTILAMLTIPASGFCAGLVDTIDFCKIEKAQQVNWRGGDGPVDFNWQYGDRSIQLNGQQVVKDGQPLEFTFKPGQVNGLLTIVLREFRTIPDSGMAYMVSVNGIDIAFRNRGYHGTGPTTAFIDLPQAMNNEAELRIRITNLCATPVCFSSISLYEDLEDHVTQSEMQLPFHVGPTTSADKDTLIKIKSLLPDTDTVKPMFVLPTFAISHWPPEVTEARLREALQLADELKMPVELQLNTWWGGTPFGCDGIGGRWSDPAYQQVTYVPSTNTFGLTIPNVWSSVPWLTVASPRMNTFKATSFKTVGQILRQAAIESKQVLPIQGLVIDNEVVYWAAGMPNTPSDLQADFNPSMVVKARAEGVKLDPRDGLAENEKAFLRKSLRDYNRQMAAGVRQGLGEGQLMDRVYTHTPNWGWSFENPMQATEAGSLVGVRIGGEWDHMQAANIGFLDQCRELGIPAGINRECSNGGGVAPDVHFAYATGCDHLSLFNISDEGLQEIKDSISAGWQSFQPTPWRPQIMSEDFMDLTRWESLFDRKDGVHTEEIWPGPMRALCAREVGKSGFARMRISAQELTGNMLFERFALSYKARAFVLNQRTTDAYLAIRAGTSPDNLHEVDRMTNDNGRRHIDLTEIVKDAPEAYIEFEFHALGLPGWVCLFELALETPWAQESLLATNQSYRADRLRCESLLTAWRAEALWELERVSNELDNSTKKAESKAIADARQALAQEDFVTARNLARNILLRNSAPPQGQWQPLAQDRNERGEVRWANAATVCFDSYETGYMGRTVDVAADVVMIMEENGVTRTMASAGELLGGDDVSLELIAGKAIRIFARRGTSSGPIIAMTPTTAFALPTVKLKNQPVRKISSMAHIQGHDPQPQPSACWLQVGPIPFKIGDTVQVRWNPQTGRIIEMILQK